MKSKIILLTTLILAIFIAGCTNTQTQEGNNEQPIVVASFFPTGEISKNIAQNTSQVYTLMPKGADPHSYEPTPRQIVELSEADIFITMGGILESVENDVMNANSQVMKLESSKNIKLISGEEHNHDEHSNEEDEHNDEHHEEEGHGHNDEESHEKGYVEVEYHEDENALAYHVDIAIPSPCYSIIENMSYDNGKAMLNITLESDPDAICIQRIEEVHHKGKIELEQNIEEFIITLDGEVVFEKHLEDIEHYDESHEDEHSDEHNHNEDEEHTHEDEHDHGEYDPHTWLSIENMIAMTQTIEEGLSQQFPQNSEQFSQNAQEYISQLENLKQRYDTTLNSCENDVIIVNHKAFGYLAQEYGFEQVSVAGFNPESEPSPRTIQNVIDTARENDVKYIFSEGQFDRRVAETIAQDIGGEVLELNPILRERHESYFDLMEENLEQLAIGLECEIQN